MQPNIGVVYKVFDCNKGDFSITSEDSDPSIFRHEGEHPGHSVDIVETFYFEERPNGEIFKIIHRDCVACGGRGYEIDGGFCHACDGRKILTIIENPPGEPEVDDGLYENPEDYDDYRLNL